MINSKKKWIVIVSLLVLTLLLSSCKDDYKSSDYIKSADAEVTNIEMVENTMEEEEIGELMDSDDKLMKFTQAMDEVHAMKEWAMTKINDIYSDLVFVKQIAKWDDSNLVWMWAEDWLYSKKYDVTVVVCNSMNTPAYVFNWTVLEWEEFDFVKAELKEMMEMMGEEWEMDMMMDGEHGDDSMMDDKSDADTMMEDENEDTSMMWDDETEEIEEEVQVATWIYTEYSDSLLANAKWDIVLFFHATWCPSCKSADKNLSASDLPAWLTILKLDYDATVDLRKKYWVTTQHTFVQVDNKWNMTEKWIWSRDLETVLEKIK